jgi:membrane-bound lytic murein transglycosylase B
MDGTGDGRVDLFDIGDASASCANYLAAQGWRKGLTDKQRRAVIWRYNRSEAYVSTVLALARSLDGQPVSAVRSSAKAPAKEAPARQASARTQRASTAKKAAKAKTASKTKPKGEQPRRRRA